MNGALEQRLVELGSHLDYPRTPDLATALRGRLVQPARPRFALTRWRAALIAFVAALVVALGVPPVRTAIAHWLGIQGVVITPVTTLPPVPSASASVLPGLGTRTSLSTAQTQAGFAILLPAALGAPDSVFTRGDLGPVVSLVYKPSPGYPQVRNTGIGLLITEFRAATNNELMGKFVGPASTITPVTVDGQPGFWITGAPHEIAYRLPGGDYVPDTLRLAGPTLVFQRGELTIRIEGAITEQQAFAVAGSLR